MSARIYKFPKVQKKAEPQKPAKAEKPAAAARRYKVLLVAGQDSAREVLAEALAKSGCEVTHYRLDARYYPALLLDLFEKNRFDVVVPTNLGIPFVYLPDLVGLTRKFGKGAGIAVVSGWVQDDFVAEVGKLPRAAFLTAPVKLEEFTARVRELAAAATEAKDEETGRLPRATRWRGFSWNGSPPVTGGCSISGGRCITAPRSSCGSLPRRRSTSSS